MLQPWGCLVQTASLHQGSPELPLAFCSTLSVNLIFHPVFWGLFLFWQSFVFVSVFFTGLYTLKRQGSTFISLIIWRLSAMPGIDHILGKYLLNKWKLLWKQHVWWDEHWNGSWKIWFPSSVLTPSACVTGDKWFIFLEPQFSHLQNWKKNTYISKKLRLESQTITWKH